MPLAARPMSGINFNFMTLFHVALVQHPMLGTKKTLALLFVAFAHCQQTIDDDGTNVADVEERKEKRGISLNLGSGLEGYSYLGPSHSRGLNRQYAPITEYGKNENGKRRLTNERILIILIIMLISHVRTVMEPKIVIKINL